MLINNIEEQIRQNLETIKNGGKPKVITIGFFTSKQFEDINKYCVENELPELLSNEIIYMGRHHYNSRVVKDGYLIDDLIKQILGVLQKDSIVKMTKHGSCLVSQTARDDGYGSEVYDEAVFEFTSRRPRVELFCTVPKGDNVSNVKKRNKA